MHKQYRKAHRAVQGDAWGTVKGYERQKCQRARRREDRWVIEDQLEDMHSDYIWKNEIRRLNEDLDVLSEDPKYYKLSGEGLDNLILSLLEEEIIQKEAICQMSEFLAQFPSKYRIIVARELYRRTSGSKIHKAAAIAYREAI